MNLKSTEKTEVNTTELVVTIDAESFEKAQEAAYQHQKKNIQIKGFRKGKVPRKLVEKMYGEGCFYEDAINAIAMTELPAILADTDLEIVDSPKLEVISASKEGVELKVILVTKPEITIADYKGMGAPKVVNEITDEMVDQQVEGLRQRNARVVTVEDRAAEMGDEVTFDFEGFFGDEAFEGGKGEDYQLKLGSGQFIPGFEEQVAGHKIDEDFDVTVSFPEDYSMTDYAGKEAVFKCKIHAISKEELPELDDEFVKDASEFETVDELKADYKKKLEEGAAASADNAFESALVQKLIEKVTDPIPHCMFEHRAEDLMKQFANQLQAQGVSMDMYLEYTGQTQDSLKATYLERAESEVKVRLALEKIAELEGISVSDEEVDAEIARIAEEVKMDVEVVKSRIPMDDLRTDLKVTKAMQLVKDNAVATEAAAE